MTPDEHRRTALDIIRRRANGAESLAIADYCYHFGLNASDADREAIAELIRTANIEITFPPKPRSDLATWDPQPGETWRYVLRDELWQVRNVDGRLELHRPGADPVPVANVADPILMQRVKAAP
jgi:hypothetical protein